MSLNRLTVGALATLLLYLALATPLAWARGVPALTGPVVDEANLLSASQQRQLADKLAAYATRSNNQLQLLIIPSLEGEVFEEYSIKVAEQWKIGNRSGSGVILLIALKERQVRLEVGQGLEGSLTDSQSSRIVRDDLTPAFKEGNYYLGVATAFGSIAKSLGGDLALNTEALGQTSRRSTRGFNPGIPFFILMLVMFVLRSIFGGRRGFGHGIGWVPTIRHGGSLGGLGGGFGGGWSGGGGGFSGGGASGRW